MKSFAVAAILSAATATEDKPAVNYVMKWKAFKEEHGKTYSSAIEEEQRYQIFKVNVDFIYSMNNKGNAFELGVTPFADLTADEFGASHFGIAMPDAMWDSLPNLGNHTYKGEELAAAVDWTTKGAVTPVKPRTMWLMLVVLDDWLFGGSLGDRQSWQACLDQRAAIR
jgi:cathepsin L